MQVPFFLYFKPLDKVRDVSMQVPRTNAPPTLAEVQILALARRLLKQTGPHQVRDGSTVEAMYRAYVPF